MKLREKAEKYAAAEVSSAESVRVNELARRMFDAGYREALKDAAEVLEKGPFGFSRNDFKHAILALGRDE